jgi:glycosyltransferase involved in cell wall biosynthesis
MALGKLLVFVDHEYWRTDGIVTTDDNYILFLQAFVPTFDRLLILGRVRPGPAEKPYRCAPHPSFEFREIPHYASLYSPIGLLRSLGMGLHTAWRAVGDADALLLGIPNPWAFVLWVLGRLRRRSVIFLVRQDVVARVRLRAPGFRRSLSLAAVMTLEAVFTLLARRTLTFTVGDAMARRYGRGGAPVHSILTSLLSADSLRSATPRTLPEAGAPKLLIWVGRLDPDKGLDALLRVFQTLVARQGDPLHLDLVGAGLIEEGVKEQVEHMGLSGRVSFHGYVPFGPRLWALYEGATLFVLPSNESEGFPKVIMEAMATGLPVVATSVAGIPFVLQDRRTALLVPHGDPERFAGAVEEILSNPTLYRSLSVAGLELASRHTLEAQRQKMLQHIAPYLQSRGKRS